MGTGDCECLHPISKHGILEVGSGTQKRIPIFKISFSLFTIKMSKKIEVQEMQRMMVAGSGKGGTHARGRCFKDGLGGCKTSIKRKWASGRHTSFFQSTTIAYSDSNPFLYVVCHNLTRASLLSYRATRCILYY